MRSTKDPPALRLTERPALIFVINCRKLSPILKTVAMLTDLDLQCSRNGLKQLNASRHSAYSLLARHPSRHAKKRRTHQSFFARCMRYWPMRTSWSPIFHGLALQDSTSS